MRGSEVAWYCSFSSKGNRAPSETRGKIMANLKFQTVQTPYGKLHTLRTYNDEGTAFYGEHRVLTHRPAGAGLVTGTYMDNLGRSGWRMGVDKDGALIAWKTVKISKRFGQESYRMRSVPGGYKGDFVKTWSRAFNGKTYSFSRIFWNGGKDGWTVRVYEGQSTKVIKEWSGKGPVKMK
ncbi:hypothetical protein SEA_JACKIEB_12 [Streptomyces phage JackieB]|nr:hypothetical protein SEA_JACKIEB_12 [Streptomyces phage JackieB]